MQHLHLDLGVFYQGPSVLVLGRPDLFDHVPAWVRLRSGGQLRALLTAFVDTDDENADLRRMWERFSPRHCFYMESGRYYSAPPGALAAQMIADLVEMFDRGRLYAAEVRGERPRQSFLGGDVSLTDLFPGLISSLATATVPILMSQLRELAPNGRPEIVEAIFNQAQAVLTPLEINLNKHRLCHFLAQIVHESAGLSDVEEDLHYRTAARLVAIFPSYFANAEAAAPYVGNPKKLANRVYANRLGNGDTASGDGYTYRGRGLIQLTGRENYRKMGAAAGLELEASPDLAAATEHLLPLAAQFWMSRKLNAIADKTDVAAVTKPINPALAGLADRRRLFALALKLWL